MRWVVPQEWDGERADRVLARLSGSSRAAARGAIEGGAVTVDGTRVVPRQSVATGQVLEGEIVDGAAPLVAEAVPFGVLYEDDHLAIIDKPAGVITHPGAGRRSGTLAAGLLHRWPGIEGVGAADRWGIVHRLDRETSGLLVVALDAAAYRALTEAMKKRKITRRYGCLVVGNPPSPTGTIDAPIGRDPRRPTRMRIDSEGRRAVTHYRVGSTWSRMALLEVTLDTGRTHQIRVHMASIGLPVAGDRVYGSGQGSERLFLHSARIELTHPVTGDTLQRSSPLPPDLTEILVGLGPSG